jgi:ribosomal protein L40E
MAIIRCTECKAKVSDKATTCPKCGAPVELSKKKQKSQVSTGCGCLIVLLVVAGIIAAFVASDDSGGKQTPSPAATQAKSTPKPASAPMPSYKIIDSDRYDAPVKTQIELHAVVSGTISESGLKALLQKLYNEAAATRGFKYHGGKPTHVFIYLYTSREHFQSGMGQWIAMLSKVGEGSKPDTRVKIELISQISAQPEVRNGLSESTRKEIFKVLVLAEDRADSEAQRRYPLEPAEHLAVGQTMSLSRQTPLMPELDPADPMVAMQRMRQLPAGSRISILAVSRKHTVPWYRVRASARSGSSLGSGWINGTALRGQSSFDPKAQLLKQGDLMDALTKKYEQEVAAKYNLTQEQLRQISVEGISKNWPMP